MPVFLQKWFASALYLVLFLSSIVFDVRCHEESADINSRASVRDCPCQDPILCKIVQRTARKEVYGFALKTEPEVYLKYDWHKLTSLAMWDWTDDLMCFAHGKGVRLDLVVNFPKENLTNKEFRQQWIADIVQSVRNKFLDGVNFDPEYPVELNSPERQALVDVVNATKFALNDALPGSKVSFDAAWASFCVDDRCYDYKGLAEVTDFLFIMSYDIQGQIWGPDCIAMSNTPFQKMVDGVRGFLALGIPPHKLVLGLPWYGYDYPCINMTENGICEIPRATYHGAPCSDLVGSQKQFDEILLLLQNSTSGRQWNFEGSAPQFNYKNATGHLHQVHYDDPQSLLFKYLWAVGNDLRGVGFWHIGCLTDMETPDKQNLRKQMWDLVPDSRTWNSFLTKTIPLMEKHIQV